MTDLSDPSPSHFQSVAGQAPMPQTHDIWKGSALQSPSYIIDICQLLNSVARFWAKLGARHDIAAGFKRAVINAAKTNVPFGEYNFYADHCLRNLLPVFNLRFNDPLS